jgi:hypothetical protein
MTLSYSWNRKIKVQSSTLTISNVTDKSFGIYKCSVKANIGNYSESINLQASSTNQGMGLQFLSFFKKSESYKHILQQQIIW